MSTIDVILLDDSINPKEEITLEKPKEYQKLLKKLKQKFENLPKYYETFILDKDNKEIKINNEEEYTMTEDILFIREVKKNNNLEQSLYDINYDKLSESKQEILDEKYNCILCSIVIKNEQPYLCYKCQKIFHEKCLNDWDKECKSQNKNLMCPNCRNELSIENWNKKLDYEEDKKFIANLMNKINDNELNKNLLIIKDKKIKELKRDKEKQAELIKNYEIFIDKTKQLFKNLINKANSIRSTLKIQPNKKLNNLSKKMVLNLKYLDIDDVSNVLNEEMEQFENYIIKHEHIIKNEKNVSKNLKNDNLNKIKNKPFVKEYTNNAEINDEIFINKSKTFSLFDNNIENIFEKKDSFGNELESNIFNNEKDENLYNKKNDQIKSSKLLRKDNKIDNNENNREKDIKKENKKIVIENKKKNKEILEININNENNKLSLNKQEKNLYFNLSKPEIVLSEDEIEYPLGSNQININMKQKPLNRKIYSELIKKMIEIIEKKMNILNINEKMEETSFDNILIKSLSELELKIINLKKNYIDTLIKRHYEKNKNNKEQIVLKVN